MFSLFKQSIFRKFIVVGGTSRLPREVQNVIYNISHNIEVDGEVIRPTPDFSIIFSSILGIILVGGSILWGYATSYPIFEEMYFFIIAFIMVYFFFHLTFFQGIIAPAWVKKHIDKYYIYVGKEGIIKKNMLLTAYISYDKLTGAKAHHSHTYGPGGTGNIYLELIVNNRTLFNPSLVTSQGPSGFHGIADYSFEDLKRIANLINQKVNYIDSDQKTYTNSQNENNDDFSFDSFNSFDTFDANMADSILDELKLHKKNVSSTSTSTIQEKIMLNGEVHEIIVSNTNNKITILYNGKEYSSYDKIENEYIKEKIKNMVSNL